MSYYQRNLCGCMGSEDPADIQARINGLTRISGGLEISRVAASAVNTTETITDSDEVAVSLKGEGNLRKKGSGGSSYAAYLAKKMGKIGCC